MTPQRRERAEAIANKFPRWFQLTVGAIISFSPILLALGVIALVYHLVG
jgi:hypothetical protein